jgi:hypothetical protein
LINILQHKPSSDARIVEKLHMASDISSSMQLQLQLQQQQQQRLLV